MDGRTDGHLAGLLVRLLAANLPLHAGWFAAAASKAAQVSFFTALSLPSPPVRMRGFVPPPPAFVHRRVFRRVLRPAADMVRRWTDMAPRQKTLLAPLPRRASAVPGLSHHLSGSGSRRYGNSGFPSSIVQMLPTFVCSPHLHRYCGFCRTACRLPAHATCADLPATCRLRVVWARFVAAVSVQRTNAMVCAPFPDFGFSYYSLGLLSVPTTGDVTLPYVWSPTFVHIVPFPLCHGLHLPHSLPPARLLILLTLSIFIFLRSHRFISFVFVIIFVFVRSFLFSFFRFVS